MGVTLDSYLKKQTNNKWREDPRTSTSGQAVTSSNQELRATCHYLIGRVDDNPLVLSELYTTL